MRINISIDSNVGIGTTTPSTPLHVIGGISLANATGAITTCSTGEIRANVTSTTGKICLCTGGGLWKCVAVS